MRALAESSGDAGGKAPHAGPGMPEVFATLEAFGTELTCAGGPVGGDVPLLDLQVEGVGGVSLRSAAAGDRDPVARG